MSHDCKTFFPGRNIQDDGEVIFRIRRLELTLVASDTQAQLMDGGRKVSVSVAPEEGRPANRTPAWALFPAARTHRSTAE